MKHALLHLGIVAGEKQISRLAGTNRERGSDDTQLARAARKFRCDMKVTRHFGPDRARRALRSYLRRGIPVILCVDQWRHWITVVKVERGRFIALDSEKRTVLTTLLWGRLRNRWVYRDLDEEREDGTIPTYYDIHAIIPRFRVRTQPNFSIARARYLRQPKNRELAKLWEQYVGDLMALAHRRTALSANVITMGTFLRRHEDMIISEVSRLQPGIDRRAARKVLDRLHFVADTHGLVIHTGEEKRAIAGFTTLLALWAAGKSRTKPEPRYQAKRRKPKAKKKRRKVKRKKIKRRKVKRRKVKRRKVKRRKVKRRKVKRRKVKRRKVKRRPKRRKKRKRKKTKRRR